MISFYFKDKLINDYFYKDNFLVPYEIWLYKNEKVTLHFLWWDNNLKIPNFMKDKVFFKIHDNYYSMIYDLFKNVKKISFLWTFHFYTHTIIFHIIYKFFNKSWFSYSKWDFNDFSIDNLIKKFKNKKSIFFYLINKLDTLSFENINHFNKILLFIWVDKYKLKTNLLSIKNAPFIPNWYNLDDLIEKKNKENIILNIGKLYDEYKKDYSFMLQSIIDNLEIIKKNNWKITFIWETKWYSNWEYIDFKEYHKEKLNILEKNNIDFEIIENIKDKNILYDYYKKSKIFLFTSNETEWDPLVQYESMFFWLYFLWTNVWTIWNNAFKEYSTIIEYWEKDKTFSNKFWEILWNIKIFKNKNIIKTNEFCKKEYSWNKNLKELFWLIT